MVYITDNPVGRICIIEKYTIGTTTEHCLLNTFFKEKSLDTTGY